MVSIGTKRGSSGLQAAQLPGLFGDLRSGADIGRDILTRLRQPATGFGSRTTAENDLINELIDLAGAETALRGLGPPTAADISARVAPALIGLRQSEQQNQLGQINALMELAGLAMPQTIAGQQSRQSGFNFGVFSQGGGS